MNELNVKWFAFVYLFKTYYSFILPFFIYILQFFEYNYYTLTNQENINLLKKDFEKAWSSCYTDNHQKCGLLVKMRYYWLPEYIAFMENTSDTYNYKINILISKKKLDSILNVEPKIEKIEFNEKETKLIQSSENKLNYVSRSGNYNNIYYTVYMRTLYSLTHNTFYDDQEILYHKIMDKYNQNNFAKVFIHGEPGVGKTYFGYLLAKKLDCYLCDEFDPTCPGDTFNELYSSCSCNSQKPLIIIMDEIDILLSKINKNNMDLHKKYLISVKDKTTWNKFLDKFEYGLYPYVILILCSNNSIDKMNQLDKSYLRNGRINIFHEMK